MPHAEHIKMESSSQYIGAYWWLFPFPHTYGSTISEDIFKEFASLHFYVANSIYVFMMGQNMYSMFMDMRENG